MIDNFKMFIFFLNLALVLAIIIFFESKPPVYPTASQQYHRSKMYEPHLDVKYLLQYKEFKVFALICGLVMAVVNCAMSIPYLFLFVEAQANENFVNVVGIWAPIACLLGIIISSVILAFFNQTNASYKGYTLALLAALGGSIVLVFISFLSRSPAIYFFSLLIQSAVCGAFKIYLYEFMTEITFPVSPVFALGILNALSGLLTLLFTLIGMDEALKDPTKFTYLYLTLILCLAVVAVAIFIFLTQPFKLNRTDYDTGRRSTMVNSYSKKEMKKAGASHDFNQTSINSLLDDQERMRR